MIKAIPIIVLSTAGFLQLAAAKDKPPSQVDLKCSEHDTPDMEAKKEVRYKDKGTEYIVYCAMGKQKTIVDHGDNG